MTNPYDPITGKWLTPFAWSPIAAAQAGGGVGSDPGLSGPAVDPFGGGQNAGGASDGYTGKVDKFSDLLGAVLGGAGTVFGGLPGAINLGVSLVGGGKSPPSTINTVKMLLQSLGIMNPPAPGPTPISLPSGDKGDGSLSGGQIEVNPTNAGGFGLGALSGTTADPATLGGLNITGNAVNTMSSPAPSSTPATPFVGVPTPSLPAIIASYSGAPAEPANGLSGGQIEISGPQGAQGVAGNLGGMLETALNGIGDITGGTGGAGLFESGSGGGNLEFNAGGGRDNSEKNAEGQQGFATGGYTGNGPRSAPAGTVHGQEFVFSAPATQALGPDVLAALNAALSRRHAPFGWGAR